MSEQNPRMGVTRWDETNVVRHIATSTPRWGDPVPICMHGRKQRLGTWLASRSRKVHELPVCKRCIQLVEATKAALDDDNGFTR